MPIGGVRGEGLFTLYPMDSVEFVFHVAFEMSNFGKEAGNLGYMGGDVLGKDDDTQDRDTNYCEGCEM